MTDQNVAQEGHPTEVNGRFVQWVTIKDQDYGLYAEPTYGDKLFLDENTFKYDLDMEYQSGEMTPQINNFTAMPRELLLMMRALAAWTRPGEVNDEAIKNLPLSVANALVAKINEDEDWASLGEVAETQ